MCKKWNRMRLHKPFSRIFFSLICLKVLKILPSCALGETKEMVFLLKTKREKDKRFCFALYIVNLKKFRISVEKIIWIDTDSLFIRNTLTKATSKGPSASLNRAKVPMRSAALEWKFWWKFANWISNWKFSQKKCWFSFAKNLSWAIFYSFRHRIDRVACPHGARPLRFALTP